MNELIWLRTRYVLTLLRTVISVCWLQFEGHFQIMRHHQWLRFRAKQTTQEIKASLLQGAAKVLQSTVLPMQGNYQSLHPGLAKVSTSPPIWNHPCTDGLGKPAQF